MSWAFYNLIQAQIFNPRAAKSGLGLELAQKPKAHENSKENETTSFILKCYLRFGNKTCFHLDIFEILTQIWTMAGLRDLGLSMTSLPAQPT